MAVALDATGTHSVITSTGLVANSYTGLTISAGLSNSAACFSIVCGVGVPTFSSVTWNGVACTQIGTVSLAGSGSITWFGIVNPASGNKTFSFTPSVSVEAYVEGCSFQNVLQTGGTSTFAHFNSAFPSGTVLTRNLAITTASGNFTMCAGLFGNVATTAFTAPTSSQIYRDATDPGGQGVTAAAAQAASTTTSTTYTGANAASDVLGLAGFDLVASAGAATVFPPWSTPGDADRTPVLLFQRDGVARQWFQPSPNPVPQRWQPTTGEEDRPARIQRPPDESIPFFRSRASIPPTWLPKLDTDGPPRQAVADPSGGAFAFKPPAAASTIAGMAWYKWEDRERPTPVWPKPGNKFFAVQIPFTPISGIAWYNWQDRERPKLPSDIYAPQFIKSPTAAVPISGIAWYNFGKDDTRPSIVWPKPGNKFFSVQISTSVGISGIAWLRQSDDRPLPLGEPQSALQMPFFIEPPLIPFYAAANADDFNPIPPFRYEERIQGSILRPIAPPVGISGIAWWRQTEVYLEPAAAYRDYKPAWDPQFVVQITPTVGPGVYNTLLLCIPNGMFAIPGNPPS